MRVLVVGPGYVGSVVAERLAAAGHEVRALRRSSAPVPGDPSPIATDVSAPIDAPREEFDAAVYAVSPSARSTDAYEAAYVDGPQHVLDWLDWPEDRGRFVLVSSTGVYGQTDGERVDETTDPRPATSTGRVLLEGERSLLARHDDAVVLRLGGIYGPGRTRTIERVATGEMPCPPGGIYGNRIHRDDAADASIHLLNLDDPHDVYIGVDRDPAELRETYRWLADRLGVPGPCESDEDEADDAPERRGTNKRCDSTRLVESGYRFTYSTFREGYGSLLND
ncbi:MAG TPA: NAD-dependent epimerase/dehydratase family protein [Longimicrobiales bacterium]|nr:NAD-dependent epimerase/dehydratase family protein [Longimicrobiales bacterium]